MYSSSDYLTKKKSNTYLTHNTSSHKYSSSNYISMKKMGLNSSNEISSMDTYKTNTVHYYKPLPVGNNDVGNNDVSDNDANVIDNPHTACCIDPLPPNNNNQYKIFNDVENIITYKLITQSINHHTKYYSYLASTKPSTDALHDVIVGFYELVANTMTMIDCYIFLPNGSCHINVTINYIDGIASILGTPPIEYNVSGDKPAVIPTIYNKNILRINVVYNSVTVISDKFIYYSTYTTLSTAIIYNSYVKSLVPYNSYNSFIHSFDSVSYNVEKNVQDGTITDQYNLSAFDDDIHMHVVPKLMHHHSIVHTEYKTYLTTISASPHFTNYIPFLTYEVPMNVILAFDATITTSSGMSIDYYISIKRVDTGNIEVYIDDIVAEVYGEPVYTTTFKSADQIIRYRIVKSKFILEIAGFDSIINTHHLGIKYTVITTHLIYNCPTPTYKKNTNTDIIKYKSHAIVTSNPNYCIDTMDYFLRRFDTTKSHILYKNIDNAILGNLNVNTFISTSSAMPSADKIPIIYHELVPNTVTMITALITSSYSSTIKLMITLQCLADKTSTIIGPPIYIHTITHEEQTITFDLVSDNIFMVHFKDQVNQSTVNKLGVKYIVSQITINA